MMTRADDDPSLHTDDVQRGRHCPVPTQQQTTRDNMTDTRRASHVIKLMMMRRAACLT